MNDDEAWRYNNAQRARRNGFTTAVRYNSGYDANHWLNRNNTIARARDRVFTALARERLAAVRQSQGGNG